MRNMLAVVVGLVGLSYLTWGQGLGAAEPQPAPQGNLLWQIGKADNSTAEFALAPGGYAQFKELPEEPLYVVGYCRPERDWPYVQPGPTDAWAGSRQHRFAIVFSLKAKPAGGTCRLLVDLVDTHDTAPPKLAITVNGGKALEVQTPKGGPDDSIFGQPEKGREHRFAMKIPAAALKEGANEIAIRTVSGSWILYDWIGFEAPEGVELAPTKLGTLVQGIERSPLLVERDGKLLQTIQVKLRHFNEPAEAVVEVTGAKPTTLNLRPGSHTVEVTVPAVEKETPAEVVVKLAGKRIATQQVVLKPVRKWVVYLLPHSHVDIGYTRLQTEVEQDHWRFFEQAIEAAKRTADYPPGAQFKWNVEVLWAVDSYLKQAPPEKKEAFIDAVRKGWIGLDALYGNELTGLCRPEELLHLVEYGQRLEKQYGFKIESAMITDVPGYTWGTTTALAAAGVKWMSMGPNSGARIGFTHEAWDEKPFYWVTPSGRHKVLCWIPEKGYYRAFTGGPELANRLTRLQEQGYPFDIVQSRYCLGDNAGPGIGLSDEVKDWNTKYAYPKLVIATTAEMMSEFERRYGDQLPEVRGDFTPYWEDGAASSALETGLNRAAAERLVQAEALWAMLDPGPYPDDNFYQAWRNAVLYDEHTWGAHCSISQPDSEFTLGQWRIKQAFALDADRQSRELLDAAVAKTRKTDGPVAAVQVLNTSSWPRTDLVVLPKEWTLAGDCVECPEGKAVPSQRLSTGELAFVAADVPAFGARRYTLKAGDAQPKGTAKAEGNRVWTAKLTATIDEKTGAIAGLRAEGLDAELVDRSAEMGLNDYFYVPGTNPADAVRCGPVTIAVKEKGPVVASLLVECDAPGCRKLSREIRVVDGLDRVDVINVVDKEKVRTKEGVNFAFPFNVPEGVMRMDIPFAVARPEEDQIAGACKNWFTVQRWIDVSNEDYGVTWATVDAPLVEVGAITAELPWIRTLEPTQTLYSYVMNNYWFTNYKADQEGPTPFRYALRPHRGGYCPVMSARFGAECSQPLVAVPAGKDAPAVTPSRLTVEPGDVVVTCLKATIDGKGWIVRLFGAGGRTTQATLHWGDPAPKSVFQSNLAEAKLEKVDGPIEVPGFGIVTLRAERE